MSVIWILERARPPDTGLPGLLQGDFAIRAFGSLRNFLRMAPLHGHRPDLLLVRSEDFSDELSNLDSLLSLRYEGVPRVYFGGSPDFLANSPAVTFIDDTEYVQMPFLLQAILRFGDEHEPGTLLQLSDLHLDMDRMRLRLTPEGEWQRLKPKEAQILRHLLRNPDRCLSHEDLVLAVWKDMRVSPRSMASHISRLRRILQGSQVEIRNVYGGGYQLCSQGANLDST